MNGGPTWGIIWAVAATMFGVLASALLGMAISRLGKIEEHLASMNGKLFNHLTDGMTHSAGFAKVEEQIKSLENVAKIAHDRIDRLKESIA